MKLFLHDHPAPVRQVFRDFDKLDTGVVTKAQFMQAISWIKCDHLLSESDAKILCREFNARKSAIDRNSFVDDGAFRYAAFVNHIDPGSNRRFPLGTTMLQPPSVEAKATKDADAVDLQNVIMKLKSKVKAERIRVVDFLQDFDRLRCGRIQSHDFYRALKSLPNFCQAFSENEMRALTKAFESDKEKGKVDYRKFSDEMESVFLVKNFETKPLVQWKEFVPLNSRGATFMASGRSLGHSESTGSSSSGNSMDLMTPAYATRALTAQEEQILDRLFLRMRSKIQQQSFEVLPFFEDFDKTKSGLVSTAQFRNVLLNCDLLGHLGVDESRLRSKTKTTVAHGASIDRETALRFYYGGYGSATTSRTAQVKAAKQYGLSDEEARVLYKQFGRLSQEGDPKTLDYWAECEDSVSHKTGALPATLPPDHPYHHHHYIDYRAFVSALSNMSVV
jgi:Ca2+-binding EF-hand superfamily protein